MHKIALRVTMSLPCRSYCSFALGMDKDEIIQYSLHDIITMYENNSELLLFSVKYVCVGESFPFSRENTETLVKLMLVPCVLCFFGRSSCLLFLSQSN